MIKKITIITLAKSSDWIRVKKALRYHYPKQKGNYEPVYNKLLKLREEKQKCPGEELEIACNKDIFGDLDDSFYSVHTNRYSLSFRKWREVSSIPISEDTLNHYKIEEILAHFIWEITFYGDEEQMIKKGKELLGIHKKILKR